MKHESSCEMLRVWCAGNLGMSSPPGRNVGLAISSSCMHRYRSILEANVSADSQSKVSVELREGEYITSGGSRFTSKHSNWKDPCAELCGVRKLICDNNTSPAARMFHVTSHVGRGPRAYKLPATALIYIQIRKLLPDGHWLQRQQQ